MGGHPNCVPLYKSRHSIGNVTSEPGSLTKVYLVSGSLI